MMENKAFDIHMHLIPDVDDGASDLETSLKMVRVAREEDIAQIIATPHGMVFERDRKRVLKNYDKLCETLASQSVAVTVHLGAEIYVDDQSIKKIIKLLKKKIMPTMNGTDYVLVEFSLGELDFGSVMENTMRLQGEGYIPVVAHVERYRLDMACIQALRENGCKLQVNYANLVPRYENQMTDLAWKLLEAREVDFLATDAHNLSYRAPVISAADNMLKSRLPMDYVDFIKYQNAINCFI